MRKQKVFSWYSRMVFLMLLATTVLAYACNKSDIEIEQKYSVAVYPNPCCDYLGIHVGTGSETIKPAGVKLYDGSESFWEVSFEVQWDTNFHIDALMNKPKGAYLMEVIVDDRIEIIEVIKVEL